MELATSSKTSVFVGAFTNDYQKSVLGKDPDVTLKYMPTGTRYAAIQIVLGTLTE